MKTLQVFNRYQYFGGEEATVKLIDQIYEDSLTSAYFHSKDWVEESLLKKFTQPFRSVYNPTSIEKIGKGGGYDADVWLFHNVMPIGSLGLFHSAQKKGIPIIQYLHNYRPFSLNGLCYKNGQNFLAGFEGNYIPEIQVAGYRDSKLQSIYMALMLSLLRSHFLNGAVKGWICQTQFMKDQFVQLGGIPAEQIEVILPPRIIQPITDPISDQNYIFFVGRLVPEKGIKVLLDAWASDINKTLPKLIIAGSGELSLEVERITEKVEHIEYVGRVSDQKKNELIRNCSAVVVPSTWMEVLGLVAFEGYEYYKPVLAARSGGLTESVIEGQTGFTHEPGNPESLIESVYKLQNTSLEQRLGMGTTGRDWLIKETNPVLWKERYERFANKIISENINLR